MYSMQKTFFFAALLALSAVFLPMRGVAQSSLADAYQKAMKLEAEAGRVIKCNPMIDEGCNFPRVPGVKGCTDCQTGMLRFQNAPEEDEIILFESLNVDGTNQILRQTLSADQLRGVQMRSLIGN